MTILVTPVKTFDIEVKRFHQTTTMSLTPQQAVFVLRCICDAYHAYQTLADNPGWQNFTTDEFELDIKVPFHNDCCNINPMMIVLEDYDCNSNTAIHLTSGQEIEDLRVALGHAMRE